MDSPVGLESTTAPMEDSISEDDQNGANPEPIGLKGAILEAHPEGSAAAANDDEDDDDDDDDDGVQVTIGAINSSPASGAGPNFNRRFSKGGVKVATPVSVAENGSEVVEKQKTTIDLEAEGNINGIPVKEFDLDSILDKPWRKPGADITDYFNYGFNELTWKAYCTKQQSLRVSNGLPAIGHPNFAPDKSASSLIETQTGGGGGGGGVGGGGFQKKPLVIDMAKIREKFNILGDRGGAVATQQRPLRRLDYNSKPTESGPSSIAVIGGSDSTSRRLPIQDTSAPLGIPTIGGSKPDQQPPAPFLTGLDMSRPPPGFPLGPPPGVQIPSFPPQVAAPSAAAPPASAHPPFGGPPPFGDPFVAAPNAASAPPFSQIPPISGPPGSSAMPPSGWPTIPPAGPPPAGFPATATAGVAVPPALQRSASPTVKEEEDEEDRGHKRSHSHHRESSRQRSNSPESRHRSRSPSRSSKDPSSSKHHRSSEKHRERKRGGEEEGSSSSSSSRSHHKKSKKSEKDRDGHRREGEEVKREME